VKISLKGDRYHLHRFVTAQNDGNVIEQVFSELAAGKKTSHWMWYIFPQIIGLGSSEISEKFAILSLAEARAYLDHPLLGTRIRRCTQTVNQTEGRLIKEIFGSDDCKFRSSMTLFAHATSDNEVFLEAIQKYFDGEFDPIKELVIQGR
jgi:uncharacterized protein (DUF1810 family)